MTPTPEKDPYEIHELIESIDDDLIEGAAQAAILKIMEAFDLGIDDVAEATYEADRG